MYAARQKEEEERLRKEYEERDKEMERKIEQRRKEIEEEKAKDLEQRKKERERAEQEAAQKEILERRRNPEKMQDYQAKVANSHDFRREDAITNTARRIPRVCAEPVMRKGKPKSRQA